MNLFERIPGVMEGFDPASEHQVNKIVNALFLHHAALLDDDRAFLDLGCGLDHMENRDSFECFHLPDRCHFAHESGWNVTGVDLGELQSSVPWKFLSADITQLQADQLFAPYDWVHTMNFLSFRNPKAISPGLVLPDGTKPFYEFRETADMLLSPEYLAFMRRTFKLVQEVLKEGGIFTLNDKDLFVKHDGVLIHAMGLNGLVLDVEAGELKEFNPG